MEANQHLRPESDINLNPVYPSHRSQRGSVLFGLGSWMARGQARKCCLARAWKLGDQYMLTRSRDALLAFAKMLTASKASWNCPSAVWLAIIYYVQCVWNILNRHCPHQQHGDEPREVQTGNNKRGHDTSGCRSRLLFPALGAYLGVIILQECDALMITAADTASASPPGGIVRRFLRELSETGTLYGQDWMGFSGTIRDVPRIGWATSAASYR
jgi:hypothetical protein